MWPEILTAAGLLAALGVSARWNWWRLPAPGVPVLMYHKVGDPPPGSQLKKLWVSVDQFRRQMAYLKKRGYAPLTLREIDALRAEGKPVPTSAVVITFDDGYRNNLENALPVLREFGFKAVIYLVVNALGRDNFWHDPSSEIRIPMLSWKEVEELEKHGFEIGSHTMNHPRLARLDAAKAADEIKESRRALEKALGRAPTAFAYPYGNGADEPALQKAVREAGYTSAVSVHQGKADWSGNLFCLNRIFVRGDDTLYDFHLNMTRGKARF